MVLSTLFNRSCGSRLLHEGGGVLARTVISVAPVPRGSSRGWAASSVGRRWRGLFSLDPAEASFAARQFYADDHTIRVHLQHLGEVFIAAFNRALCADDPVETRHVLEVVDPDLRGFAAEGAAMGCAIADAVMLGGNRLGAWVDGTAGEFTYLTHVGAGWALARVPWRRRPILGCLDPVHRWLAFDGLGFHDAYFFSRRVAAGWRRLRTGYAVQTYDQGVGRAIWFIAGGSVARAIDVVRRFSSGRHADLWSGLGLALAYAGGADPAGLRLAVQAAGGARPWLAQGAAFAAEARARANHVPAYTHEAVKILSGRDTGEALHLVRQVRASLSPVESGDTPRYELWRRGVQHALGPAGGARHA